MKMLIIALLMVIAPSLCLARASVVPVVCDILTKKVKRWAVLDADTQLSDPAFGAADTSEMVVRIPDEIYTTFRHDPKTGITAFDQIEALCGAPLK